MTTKQAIAELRTRLVDLYDQREASAMADWILEDLTGSSRIDRLMTDEVLTEIQEELLRSQSDALAAGKPIQYVLGYAWFMGMRFKVDHHVLIPRPETEELVQWVKEDNIKEGTLLDIGTGSGCIPIMIKSNSPGLQVHSTDISPEAIAVAKENAASLGADVEFHCGDFTDSHFNTSLPSPAVIISNPPYIPLKDKDVMHQNVVEHEPHLALFVPDDDALVFYRHIIAFAIAKNTSRIYLETHADLADAVAALGCKNNYEAEIRNDMQGKPRMVRLSKSNS